MLLRFALNQNRSLHLLVAMSILAYALIPLTGFCSCEGCNCENKLTIANKVAQDYSDEQPISFSCCCSVKKPVRKSCCSEKTRTFEQQNFDESDSSCKCSCSITKDSTAIPQNATDILSGLAQDLREQLVATVAFYSQIEPCFESFVQYVGFETPVSRLPVRLHLLNLVLLN